MVQDIAERSNDVPDVAISSTRKALEQSLHLPESFYIGQAAGEGDCFFDSVAQGLFQIRPNEKFTVKSLRMVCKSFAERSLSYDNARWFLDSLAYEEKSNKELPLDRYIESIEFTAGECENTEVLQNGPIWGRPEIEGRILCEEYCIQLHVAERHQGLEDSDVWTSDRISVTGSMASPPQYDDENIVYIVNYSGCHFEPILRKNNIPASKLQHLNDECEQENMIVDEMLHKLGELFSGSAHKGPAWTQQYLCRGKNLMKNTGLVIMNSRDIELESPHAPRKCSDAVPDGGQDVSVIFNDAIMSGDLDRVRKLLQQWRSWPFDIVNIPFKFEKPGNNFVHELLAYLNVNEESVSGEMCGLLEEEVPLRKYLLDVAQTTTSVRDIARKSKEGYFYQHENHDILISELLSTTLNTLMSWIDYHERFVEKGEECHHHKLNLLLFSLVTRNVESIQEQSDKLGLSRMLYREVENSLGGLLDILINYERLKYIVDSVTRVKTELLQDSCNKAALENVEKCDSLLRDIRNCSNRDQHGNLEIDSVKSLWKHLENLGEKLSVAKLQVEEFDNISETSSSESSLALIKDKLILDEVTRNLQLVHQEDAHWFRRFLFQRILQLCEQSTLRPLQSLIINVGDNLQDIWKMIQVEVQDAIERLNAETTKMDSKESSAGQADLTNDARTDRTEQEKIDCNVGNEQFPDVKFRTTFERIHAEFGQLLNSVNYNSSVAHQKLIHRIDCKCAPALCTKFVTATARSEIKMVVATSDKQKSKKESQSPGLERDAKFQGSIEVTVDRLIKNTLNDFLSKTQRGKDSDESLMKFQTSISKDYQINEKKFSLQSFYNTSLTFSSSIAKSISGNQYNFLEESVQTSLKEMNSVIENATKELPELPIYFEKMAARKIVSERRGHFTTCLHETFSRIKIVISKCNTYMEILQLCKHNLPLRSSLEMLVWESLKILKAACSSAVYALMENILCTSMAFVGHLPYCPFISISLFDYLRPGSLLGAFIGDRLLTIVLLGHFLSTEGEMLIAIQNTLEINGGCEFLVNSLSSSFDENGMKKPISKFDELVEIMKNSRYWKNDLWKRNLIALLKNQQVTDNHRAKDQQFVWHFFEWEIFDECNFKNIDIWRTRMNIDAIQGPHGYSLLHMACKVGDGCLVEDLLKNGSEVNSFDDNRDTPLHIASYHDNIDVMRLLIENSANLNLVNDHHMTALHIAVSCGLVQNVQLLLNNGVDIEATTVNGFTPLFFALPHVEVVKVLLDHKANVNARNKDNSTPLHEASRLGHKGSLKLLLTNEAKINAIDNSHGTPLHIAVVHGQTDIVRTLFHHGADIYDVCRSKCTLVHHAAFSGRDEILKMMLEKGLKIDKLDEYGMTPLHLAAIGGHLHIIEILQHYLPTSTFIDIADLKRRTALHYAAMQEDHKLVDALVRLGACANVVDTEGSTPLHMTAMRSNIKATTFLISNGANIEALDHNMCTPLTVTAQIGCKEFCDSVRGIPKDEDTIEELPNNQLSTEQPKSLPESIKSLPLIVSSSTNLSPKEDNRSTKGTDISDKNHVEDDRNDRAANTNNDTQKTDQKITSLKSNQNFKLIQQIKVGENLNQRLTSPSPQWAPIHIAVVNNDVDVIRTLLINKGGVNTLGEDNVTPLHVAAEMGYVHCVDILLKKGADVNAVSGFHRRTSLHFASRNGHAAIIGKLIAARADVNHRDELGNTPIHLAAERGETECAKLLLDNGSNINSYNDNRSTPLHIAAFHDRCQLLEMFLKHNADIDSIDAHGCTPLSLTVQQSLASASAILLSGGANTSIRDKDGWAPLHISTRNDNVNFMKTLLDSQADVDICGKDNVCPLHLTVIKGSIRSIKLLLDRGTDINKRNHTNQTPLHLACQTGDCAVIHMLLARGASTEVTDANGFTPLLEAIQNGHANAVQELVNAGANVECYCKKYDIRPIYAAIASRRLDIVRTLVEHGAKINVQNKKHITPLILAAFYCVPEAIELLLENKANIDASDKQNNSPLHIAARGGYVDVVKVLLLNGANVDALNDRNWSPLHEAIEIRHRDVVEMLLASGASLDIPLEKSMSALHFAAGRGDLEIVALLEAADADVNAQDRSNSQTPLHHAVQKGHIEIAQFLILNGANVNVVDAGGLTPLRLAIGIQNIPMANLLLDNGADVNVQDDNQVTPLQVAVKNGVSAELIQKLLDAGADVNSSNREQCFTTLHLAIAQNNVGIFEVLLRNGADVNSRSNTGARPLHLASGQGRSSFAKMLIESFADVNCLTTEGLTPLHEAAGEGHLEIVNILLDHSADVNAKDNNHCRPLHCAACEGHDEVVVSLLNRGAKVDSALKSGKTALYLSVDGGHAQAMKTLLQHGANAHARTANGSTMLHAAAISNDVEIIQLILKAMTTGQLNLNQNLEATNDRGDTALITATWSKKKISVDVLLKLGASPNARNCRGFTALHYAARNGDNDVVNILCSEPKVDSVQTNKTRMDTTLDMLNSSGDAALHLAILSNHEKVVETLMQRGANVHLLDDNHFSPLHLAAEKGFSKILEILCLCGADTNASNNSDLFTPLHLAAMEGHAKTVRMLVQMGVLLDRPLKGYDITPLYLAVQNGHAKVAKILLDNGANPVAVRHPSTVLHAAICSGNVEIVKLVINEINSKELCVEPFLNAMDFAGDTPLMWAAQTGKTDICKVLLNYGASVHLENSKKMTALHWAATNGHPDVVKILLRYRAKRDIKDNDSNTPLYLAMCGKAQENERGHDYDGVIQLLSRK